jgi:hypothetical protein
LYAVDNNIDDPEEIEILLQMQNEAEDSSEYDIHEEEIGNVLP